MKPLCTSLALAATALLAAGPATLLAKDSDTLTRFLADYDKNGDRVIDVAELQAYLEKAGSLGKAFTKMDADKDQVVTAAERDKAITAQAQDDIGAYGATGDTVMDPEVFNGYLKDTSKDYAAMLDEERRANDPFLRFFGEGFRLRNSLLVDPAKIDKPATLGLVWDGKADTTTYFFDGAVQYEFNMKNGVIAPTVEAHITDDGKATRDQLTVGVPFWFVLNPGSEAITEAKPGEKLGAWNGVGHTIQVNPLYTRDRVADLELLQLGLVYTPTIPALGIGNRKLGAFSWRPYLGIDYVHALDATPAAIARLGDEDLVRPFARVAASLEIIPQRWVITGNATWRHQFGSAEDDFFYYGLSSDIYLDKDQHFSLNIAWERGENEPTFKDVEFLRASIGMKF